MAIPLGAPTSNVVANLGAPTSTTASGPMTIDHSGLTYAPDAVGGVNYFQNGTPVTREQFSAAGLGQYDTGAIESQAAANFKAGQNNNTNNTNTAANAAAAAAAAQKAALQGAFDEAHRTYLNQADVATDTAGTALKSGILDYVNNLKAGQTKIDRDAVQNELSKYQGTQGVLSMVGHGLQSGGITLANKNASNSSASEALARAYGVLGRDAQTQVGNEYEKGANTIANEQYDLVNGANGISTQQRHYEEQKVTAINQIVTTAQTQLAALNTSLAYASLPEKIQIQQEIDKIKSDASSKLSQYDNLLHEQTAGINPASQADNQAKAHNLAIAGTAPENSFNFSAIPPAVVQNTGPSASPLPIFTLPSSKKSQ